ncbi:MAG: hypothetical protein ACU836_07610 [Gammaproteobacteria bacterium]
MPWVEKLKLSLEDYSQGELLSEIRHEYCNGDVNPMSGTKRAHSIISMNLAGIVFLHISVGRLAGPLTSI